MRRSILSVLACGAIGAALIAQTPEGKGGDTLVYIGSYTGSTAKGIYLFRLQPEGDEVFQNVTLVPLGLAPRRRIRRSSRSI